MLTAAAFAGFYQQVHQRRAFPWQQGLVERVLTEGRWPGLVDVPTGLGKTSMLDIAVFVAAVTAGQRDAGRLGRRRCLLVVDRRIVVDEATDHARKLAAALADAERGDQGVVGEVARALRSYAPAAGGAVLPVVRMRGGTTWASAWLDRPDRPGVVIGTVDQVGSRLLFRGYGVSDRRRPIDAALVGVDALLLVDEAHLATALTATLRAAQARDRCALPLPGLDVVQLTATPGAADPVRREAGADVPAAVFPFDVEAHLAEPVAGRRLTAGKRMLLVQTTAKDTPRTLAEAAARLALGPAPQAGDEAWPAAVLVVCNTVDRARAVHGLLVERSVDRAGQPVLDTDLLIGRSRPADRAGLQAQVLRRYGRDRTRAARPAVLVATQTVEVGINIDADGLVTESASWDALVQRLGRLNRFGAYPQRRTGQPPAAAVVVHDGQADGPVYGPARDVTWQHLSTLTRPAADLADLPDGVGLGVSPLQCRRLTDGGPDRMPDAAYRAVPGAPVVQTPTLDAWTRTGPVPAFTDPPIAPFLHGFSAGSAAVLLAWRDGLLAAADPLDDPFDESGDLPASAATANALLTAIPLRSAEQVEVPIHAVRQWLAGQATAPVGDLDATPDQTPARPRQNRDPIRVLVWRAAGGPLAAGGAWTWLSGDQVGPADLRPGDQIVVPSEHGGLDRYGWHPGNTTRVADRGEYVAFAHRRPLLRVDPGLPGRLGLTGPGSADVAGAIRLLYQPEDTLSDGPDGITREDVQANLLRALQTALTGPVREASGDEASNPAAATDEPLAAVGVTAAQMAAWVASGPRFTEIQDPAPAAVVGGSTPVRPLLYLLTGGAPPTPSLEVQSELLDALPADGIERDDEGAPGSSLAPGPVSLDQHHAAVRDRAGQIADALGLGPDLARAVGDAAGWHDFGKLDARFQVMLHGGDEYAALVAPVPLAKSGMPADGRAALRRARENSRLPAGARHEAWSAAIVDAYLQQRSDPYPADEDLVVHLVASHHGHARPLLPPVVDRDPRPIQATIDGVAVTVASERTVCLDHPARFADLNHRYGRWGLALLEAVVRCADMTVSAEGS